MAKLRFKLNRAGVKELLFSPEMKAILNEAASSRYSSTDGDVIEWLAPTRPVVQVRGENGNNRMLKRLYGGKKRD